MQNADVLVSVVAPVRDAEAYIGIFVSELVSILRNHLSHYEVVLVDNASSDQTVQAILEVQARFENIQLYCLNRHCTLNVAIVAGLDNSIGDLVFTIDPTTDPITLIPEMLAKAFDGAEVVYGERQDVQPGLRARLYRKLSRSFFSWFTRFTGVRIPSSNSNLRLYSRNVVNFLLQNNDRHQLLRVLPGYATLNQASVPYKGKSGQASDNGENGILQAVSNASVIILATSNVALRLLTVLSLLSSSLSLLYVLYIVVIAIIKRHVIEGWISLALPTAVMFFLISTVLGILSEYIYLIAQESRRRPPYHIRKESSSSVILAERNLNVLDSQGQLGQRQADSGAKKAFT